MQRLEITNFIELTVVRFVHPRIWAKEKKQHILGTCSSKLNKSYTFGTFFPINRNLFQKWSKQTSPLSAIKHFLVTVVLKYQILLKQRRENLPQNIRMPLVLSDSPMHTFNPESRPHISLKSRPSNKANPGSRIT